MTTETRKKQTKRGRRPPVQMIVTDGEPSAVILDIAEYRDLLERAEDADGLRILKQMRKRPLKFRKLDESSVEQSSRTGPFY